MLTVTTPDRRHRPHSAVFIFKFEHNSHLFLTFVLLIGAGK